MQGENTISPSAAKRPPRECHKCPRNGKGDPYCYEKCLGPADDSNKGINKVMLGSLESQDEFIGAYADPLASRENEMTRNPYDIIGEAVDCADEEGADDGEAALSWEEAGQPEDSRADDDRRVTQDLTDEVERALVPIIANLMSLQDQQLCIFRHVFYGEDLKKIGRTLPVPISKQAVFKQLLKMVRENKVVAKVIHGMMRKGHGGAKRKQTEQLELFSWLEDTM